MKSSTDVDADLEHECVVQSWGTNSPLAVGKHDQAVLRAIRPDQLPLEELILALSAGGRFQLDLSVGIQVAGCPVQIALIRLSGSDTLPKTQLHDLLSGIESRHPSLLSGESHPNAIQGPRTTSSQLTRFGEIEIDFRKMELRRCGNRVEVTAHEFKTLQYLVSHPEEAISRNELLDRVWGYQNYPTTRTVDNRMLKLRKKLERNPSEPVHLITVRGVGYKFVP